MFCKACSAPLYDDETTCTGCGSTIDRAAAVPRGPDAEDALAVAVAVPVESTPAPVPEVVSIPEDAARCPVHPDRIAEYTCRRCGRFVCITCEPRFEDGKALCPECIQVEDGARYERIGGWLWLPAIGFTLKPVAYAIGAGGILFGMQLDRFWEQEIASGLALLGAVSLVLFVFSVFTAVRMYQRRRVFPALAITWYLIEVGVTLLFKDLNEAFGEDGTKDLLRSVVGAAIWVPYFMTSKRVARTFVR